MKKKVMFLMMLMVLCVMCLTGCTGQYRAVIEVDDTGAAALTSSTAYYPQPLIADWAYANKDVSDSDLPDWVDTWGPNSYLRIGDDNWDYHDTSVSRADPMYYIQTSFKTGSLIYDHMLSASSTGSVYEIGIHSGQYDITNLEDYVDEFDAEFTVTSDGQFGLEKVTVGTKEYVVGGSYITYKGNSVWVIDVDGLIRANWDTVVAQAQQTGIPTLQIHFSTSALTNTSGSYRQFTDVANTAWYADAVNTLAWNGYINGVGNDCFAPMGNLTVAQVCKLITSVVVPDLDTTNPTSYWAYPYVKYCVENYWVESRGDFTAANYDVPIRRAEAIHAVAVGFGYLGVSDILTYTYATDLGLTHMEWLTAKEETGKYPWASMIGQYTMYNNLEGFNFTATGRRTTDMLGSGNVDCSDFISGSVDLSKYAITFANMYSYGIVNGDGAGNFNPLGYLTRAEYCQILYNIMYYDFVHTATPHHASLANWGNTAYNLYCDYFNIKNGSSSGFNSAS